MSRQSGPSPWSLASLNAETFSRQTSTCDAMNDEIGLGTGSRGGRSSRSPRRFRPAPCHVSRAHDAVWAFMGCHGILWVSMDLNELLRVLAVSVVVVFRRRLRWCRKGLQWSRVAKAPGGRDNALRTRSFPTTHQPHARATDTGHGPVSDPRPYRCQDRGFEPAFGRVPIATVIGPRAGFACLAGASRLISS